MSKIYYCSDKDVFEYRGYFYRPEDDFEDDNVKRFHNVYVEFDGMRFEVDSIPFSPYENLDKMTFQLWVQAGRPNRERLGGYTKQHHIKYWQKLFDKALDNILLDQNED